jgi:serine/threonine-protein kinase 24/25/MST4
MSANSSLSSCDAFELGPRIGKGSFGNVYRGSVKASGDAVAIKVIDLEHAEDEIDDIVGEIGLLAQCGSAHVTRFVGAFVNRSSLWIVMEYLAGGSVADLMQAGALDERHIAVVCRDVLLALVYLHRDGTLHRDIKAANVLLSGGGDVKLADFGVSVQLYAQHGGGGSSTASVGTPYFMAPEVIKQQGYDCKADVWSLGITAIELAQGEPPWAEHHPMRVLFLIPKNPPPKATRDGLSRSFHDFVATALQKQPSQRPHARDLVKHKFCAQAPANSVLVPVIERYRKWKASGAAPRDDDSDDDSGSGKKPRAGRRATKASAAADEPSWDFTGDEELAKEAEIGVLPKSIASPSAPTATSRAVPSVPSESAKSAAAAASPAAPMAASALVAKSSPASSPSKAAEASSETPRKSAAKRAALHQVVYPVLSTLVKKNQAQPEVVRALAELKVAFDHLEAAQAGATHSLIAQLVSVLSK